MEGRRIPAVTFKCRVDGEWTDVTTKDIFKNKRVVVFSLPGAFTPTCSSTHLPGYEAHYEEHTPSVPALKGPFCLRIVDLLMAFP